VKDKHQLPPSPVRLPPDLKKWLQHEAVDAGRSLNKEILCRLEKSRKAQQKEKELIYEQ